MGKTVRAGFSTYDVSYKGDNSDRPAILDLVRWFGWKKSLLIWRYLRYIRQERNLDHEWINHMNKLSFMIEMGGVCGHPVRRLFAQFVGEDGLEEWTKS